ncbi:DUF202 domain-containing protein [Haladaptatus salinisoli]|uniref:DUF202 domain-containing protein n=1 Tax=Haladaptatus salinisoli TaxID=2884876 RepID=UPI001D0B60A6|nr:DUF202 domain-containing protein [Haladaptatus salinisoli]
MTDRDRFDPTEHTLKLAEERRKLARERTILAHIRTGFASFIFGTTVIGFFENLTSDLAGGLFIFVGVAFLVTGWKSYAESNRRTRELLEEAEQSFHRF